MSHCHCGEFDRPTIAPDEFGETCFHERGKCEVPPVPVPIETVLRLTRARAEQAEAAITRVRELHGRHDPNCPYGEDCAGAGLCLACREEYPCATIRALDGPCPTCRGPIRETVGLVCQTCGTDYGRLDGTA